MARYRTARNNPNETSRRDGQPPARVPLTPPPRENIDDDGYSSNWETSDSDSGAQQAQELPAEPKSCMRTRFLTRARGIFRQPTRYRNVANRPPTPWVQQQLGSSAGVQVTEREVQDRRLGTTLQSPDAIETQNDTTINPGRVTSLRRPARISRSSVPSTQRDQPRDAAPAGNHTQVDDYNVHSAEQNARLSGEALPWEETREPQRLQPLLPDWERFPHQEPPNTRQTSLQPSPIEYYTGIMHYTRAESPVAPETPPPPYENIGYPLSHQGNVGLAALRNPVNLPPVPRMLLSRIQHAFGLFDVLPSALGGEWVDGIISADTGLVIYRNTTRSFADDPEAIIHIRNTSVRMPASAILGFRGAGSLRIHRNGTAGESIAIDEETTLEVAADMAPVGLDDVVYRMP